MANRAGQRLLWGLLLGFHIGLFFLLTLILHKTALTLAIPYLITFVAPVPIFVLVASWLRKWETHRPPPKLLALCWSAMVGLLAATTNGAIFYYGRKLQFFHPSFGEAGFVIAACVLSAAIPMYFRTLPIILARANAQDHR